MRICGLLNTRKEINAVPIKNFYLRPKVPDICMKIYKAKGSLKFLMRYMKFEKTYPAAYFCCCLYLCDIDKNLINLGNAFKLLFSFSMKNVFVRHEWWGSLCHICFISSFNLISWERETHKRGHKLRCRFRIYDFTV